MPKKHPPLELVVKVPSDMIPNALAYAKAELKISKLSALTWLAKEALEDVKSRWPVDTGRSRKYMYVQTMGNTIVFKNKMRYAYWVERKHFPIQPFLRTKWPTLMKRLKSHLKREVKRLGG